MIMSLRVFILHSPLSIIHYLPYVHQPVAFKLAQAFQTVFIETQCPFAVDGHVARRASSELCLHVRDQRRTVSALVPESHFSLVVIHGSIFVLHSNDSFHAVGVDAVYPLALPLGSPDCEPDAHAVAQAGASMTGPSKLVIVKRRW